MSVRSGDVISLIAFGVFLWIVGGGALFRKEWFRDFFDRATGRKHSDGIINSQRFLLFGVTFIGGALAFAGAATIGR